jgi:hypothetical protein
VAWVPRPRARPIARFIVGGALAATAGPRLGWTPWPALDAAWLVAALAGCAIAVRRSDGPAHLVRNVVWSVGLLSSALVLGLIIGGIRSRAAFGDGADRLQVGLEAIRRGDRPAALRSLEAGLTDLRAARSGLHAWYAQPALVLPVVGRNLEGMQDVLDAAIHLAMVGREGLRAIDPDRVTGRPGRLDISALHDLEVPLERLVAQLEAIGRTLRGERSAWLVDPVDRRFRRLDRTIDRSLRSATLGHDLVRAAPAMLGEGRHRTYLVLFTTQSESRGTGFPGSYAELDLDGGVIHLARFGRLGDLRAGRGERAVVVPADYRARYGAFDPIDELRNLTLSPDFPTVADLARQIYAQAGGDPVDGVIRLDTKALGAMLHLTGPLTVTGVPQVLTSRNAATYLERDQYTSFNPATRERVDALGAIGQEVFEALVAAPLPDPSELGRTLGPLIARGDLAFVPADRSERRLVGELGSLGTVLAPAGDDLGVILNNAAGNKVDAYLVRDVAYDVRWDPRSGGIDATATITLHNGAPSTGLPNIVIGNETATFDPGHALPPGTNRSWLTVYSRWSLRSAALDGAAIELQQLPELGRSAYSAFVDVPAGATRTLVVRLEGSLPPGPSYDLRVWRQRLVLPGRVLIRLEAPGFELTRPPRGGRARETLLDEQPLDQDRTLRAVATSSRPGVGGG